MTMSQRPHYTTLTTSLLLFFLLLLTWSSCIPTASAHLFGSGSLLGRGFDDLLLGTRDPYQSLSRRPRPRAHDCPAPLKHQQLQVEDTETDYALRVALPGVQKHDISLDVQPGSLVIKASRFPAAGCEYNGGRYDAYGRFIPYAETWSETVRLPTSTTADDVRATFQHQQLLVRVRKPSSPAADTRQHQAARTQPQPQQQQQSQHHQQQQPKQQHQRHQQHQQQQQQQQQQAAADKASRFFFSWESLETLLAQLLRSQSATSDASRTGTAQEAAPPADPALVGDAAEPRYFSIPLENTDPKPSTVLVEDSPVQLLD